VRQSIEVLLVGLGEGVKVLLRRLDLGMPHSLHDALQVRSTREQPGRMSMSEVVHAHSKVDAARLDLSRGAALLTWANGESVALL